MHLSPKWKHTDCTAYHKKDWTAGLWVELQQPIHEKNRSPVLPFATYEDKWPLPFILCLLCHCGALSAKVWSQDSLDFEVEEGFS